MLVLDHERLRPSDKFPSHGRTARKPKTDAAVAGGKGDQDASLSSRAQQQMRGDRALAQKAVEIETFIDIERQALLGCGISHTGRRRHSERDTRHPTTQDEACELPAEKALHGTLARSD